VPRKGFTLIEVLVAVSILVIILSVVYGAYTSNLDTIQQAERYGRVDQVARVVLERMTMDLMGAVGRASLMETAAEVGFVAENGEIEGAPADRIHFTSTAHLALRPTEPRTDLCEIGYHLEKDPDHEGMILYRRDDPTPDDDLTEGGLSLELAKGIERLEFVFQDAEGTEHEAWNTLEGSPGPLLPRLVAITLGVLDDEGRSHIFTTSVHPPLSG